MVLVNLWLKLIELNYFILRSSYFYFVKKTTPINLTPLKKMKKLFTVLSVALGLGLANAQQVTPTKTTNTPSQVKMQSAKTVVTKTPLAKPAVAHKTTKTNTAAVMKKDGTPDKRYKANQHLKKDGTVDKRYKK